MLTESICSLPEFREAFGKLNVQLSDRDAQALFLYIDRHGNSDGVLQHEDFAGLVQVPSHNTARWTVLRC